jgi:TatD DNase family protein
MQLIDTHAHLYLEQFDSDRNEMISRSISKGINIMLLPNIDKDSIGPMLEVCKSFPENCFPMIGLHPTSVKEDVDEQLNIIENQLIDGNYIAIGEIGIDLYWDVTFKEQQISAFKQQLRWAKQFKLPVAIHTREAFPLILDLLEAEYDDTLTGVFHCFNGSLSDAERIMKMGFMMGIGGVMTYKKSGLPEVVAEISLEFLVLETDAPFLPPVPFRGQRNESAYIYEIASKLAEVKNVTLEIIAQKTTENALKLFCLEVL